MSFTATFIRTCGACLAVFFAASASAQPKATDHPQSARSGSRAQAQAKPGTGAEDPSIQALRQRALGLQKAKLENGLRIVMDPQPDSPTIAVCVTYDVGSRNEGPGQSGFAHLFEHMMFQGSRHVPKGGHFQTIASRGGVLNGTTSSDRTNYYETLPASELKLALWLEADRMRWLNVSEANLDNQRAVVKEEYRMRVENAPYGLAHIELDKLLFAGYDPYAHPTIGSMEDLDRAKLEWVTDFHAQYYAPNNAVLTITGGFEPDEAMRWVHEYFDAATPHAVKPYAPPPVPSQPTRENVVEIVDKNAKTPALFMGWRIMPHSEPGHAALELATRLLSDGESSLLHESLVRQLAIARNVTAYTYDHAGPDAFAIRVEMTQDAQFSRVQAAVDSVLVSLAQRGPTTEQLNRALQRAKSSTLMDLQTNLSRATTFGEYEVVFGDARKVITDLEHLLAVTPEQVKLAMRQHLPQLQRTVLRVKPMETKAQTGGSAQ